MIYSEIHIWGDSVARSILYQEAKARYAISSIRYTSLLESTFAVKICDHSVMGKTAQDGLASFLQSEPAPGALCAIEYGGNDCDLNWAYVADHPTEAISAKVPLPLYREALLQFVASAKERGMHPLLVTPVPLHAERYFRWVTKGLNADAVLQALYDVQGIYRWQERYTIAMRDVAQQSGCPLLDLRDAFLSRLDYETLMCVDGIHPNEAGHRLIAETVQQAALNSGHFQKREDHSTSASGAACNGTTHSCTRAG